MLNSDELLDLARNIVAIKRSFTSTEWKRTARQSGGVTNTGANTTGGLVPKRGRGSVTRRGHSPSSGDREFTGSAG